MDFNFEENLFAQERKHIVGVDEVGRGSLAGPLIVAAICFPKDFPKKAGMLSKIKNSKQLNPIKREQFYYYIIDYAISWSVGIYDNKEIDKIGVGNANRDCVNRAIQKLNVKPCFIASDYIGKLKLNYPFENIKKGDEKVFTIACASIIAKVHRDEIMKDYAKEFPQYGFEKHKGYGTKYHIEKIKEFGLSPIHRSSFCQKIY